MERDTMDAIEYFFINLDMYIFYNPNGDCENSCNNIFSKTSEPSFEFLFKIDRDLFYENYK